MHAPVAETGNGSAGSSSGTSTITPYRAIRLQTFRDADVRPWRQMLRRRGQGRPYSWERLQKLVRRWLPSVHILRPYPSVGFAAKHPR